VPRLTEPPIVGAFTHVDDARWIERHQRLAELVAVMFLAMHEHMHMRVTSRHVRVPDPDRNATRCQHIVESSSAYRVSTDKQGRSGLGLDAQKAAVADRLNGGRWQIVGEFVEVESGKRASRPQLDATIAACKKHKAKLIVAKLDRLSRNVPFLLKLIDSGVEVLFADLPELNGAMGRFMLTTMASVVEFEAGLISERTKAALKVAKARVMETP
jgi:hypothetical protein